MDPIVRNNLLNSIANPYRTRPVNKETPNLLRDLLCDIPEFDRDVIYIAYCYYSCKMSLQEVHKMFFHDYTVAQIETIILNKMAPT